MSAYLGVISSLFILISFTLHNLTSNYPDFQIVLEATIFSVGMFFLSSMISYALIANGSTRSRKLELIIKNKIIVTVSDMAIYLFWLCGYILLFGHIEQLKVDLLYLAIIPIVVLFLSFYLHLPPRSINQ